MGSYDRLGGVVEQKFSAVGLGNSQSPYIPLFGFGDTPSLDAFGRLRVSNRTTLTLDASGAARALGTLSINGYGYSGTSPVRLNLNWREVR